MLRLGVGAQGVTEILGIAEHVVSISAAAEGLRIRPDLPDSPLGPPTELLPPVDDPDAEHEGTLAAIGTWARERLGADRAPAFWRVMARQPRFLDALWATHQLVLGTGRLGQAAKVFVALGVAMNQRSPYWTSYFTQLGRRTCALNDDLLAELTACVIHIVSRNTVAHGMRLEAPYTDIDPKNLPADPAGAG